MDDHVRGKWRVYVKKVVKEGARGDEELSEVIRVCEVMSKKGE